MAKQFASAVIGALFGFTGLAAAQGTPQDLVGTLRSGTITARHQAARDVLQIPPQERDAALWVVLADELQRVGSESHERDDALAAGRRVDPMGEGSSGYYQDLVRAVTQWQNPRALQPLIASAGRGMLVIQGIVPFGERAVPPLVQAARTGHRGEQAGSPACVEDPPGRFSS